MGERPPLFLASNASVFRANVKLFCNFFVTFIVKLVALAKQPTSPTSKTNLEDVRAFLQRLHEKMAFKAPFSLVFLAGSGDKNLKALPHLAELGVSPKEGRQAIIESLVPVDYCEGPIANWDPAPHGGDLWVFGKHIKGEPYYIKMQIGHTNRSAICVSFHPAEHKLLFPLKG